MVRMEMMVTRMDHTKRQDLNVTFDDTKNKPMDCFNYLKERRPAPCPISLPARAGFVSLRRTMSGQDWQDARCQLWHSMISCCMRRGGMHPRPLLMPSSRKPHSLRLLPAISLLSAKSLSPARHQAGLSTLRRRCQIVTTQMSSNLPPPPPTPSLNFSKQGIHATFGECYCTSFVF